jgi:hypothetical protein
MAWSSSIAVLVATVVPRPRLRPVVPARELADKTRRQDTSSASRRLARQESGCTPVRAFSLGPVPRFCCAANGEPGRASRIAQHERKSFMREPTTSRAPFSARGKAG